MQINTFVQVFTPKPKIGSFQFLTKIHKAFIIYTKVIRIFEQKNSGIEKTDTFDFE